MLLSDIRDDMRVVPQARDVCARPYTSAIRGSGYFVSQLISTNSPILCTPLCIQLLVVSDGCRPAGSEV